jgi:two-component system cell cycle response regulator DivK
MKILVVEDEPNNMKLMSFIIKKFGHEPVEAFTGVQGIEKAQSSNADVILMDIKLPDMDGFEVTEKIREMDMKVPIIAITSYSMDENLEAMDKAGFNGCIEKPINPMTILDEINRIISKGRS